MDRERQKETEGQNKRDRDRGYPAPSNAPGRPPCGARPPSATETRATFVARRVRVAAAPGDDRESRLSQQRRHRGDTPGAETRGRGAAALRPFVAPATAAETVALSWRCSQRQSSHCCVRHEQSRSTRRATLAYDRGCPPQRGGEGNNGSTDASPRGSHQRRWVQVGGGEARNDAGHIEFGVTRSSRPSQVGRAPLLRGERVCAAAAAQKKGSRRRAVSGRLILGLHLSAPRTRRGARNKKRGGISLLSRPDTIFIERAGRPNVPRPPIRVDAFVAGRGRSLASHTTRSCGHLFDSATGRLLPASSARRL
ncbi:hypothetical protein MTO96_002931 [Rhipicephalus appendiculatus]